MKLAESLNAVAINKSSSTDHEYNKNDSKRIASKRSTNRSVTCSEDLRDRLRVMAANRKIPMQELLESWMREKLTEAGF